MGTGAAAGLDDDDEAKITIVQVGEKAREYNANNKTEGNRYNKQASNAAGGNKQGGKGGGGNQ